eukprot:CAMPEP_0174895732 /NCGR_PEP_ID=MMETSP0167-20121228/10060_1 /TAXON_ID=38298 /ORGANISM="Rhodella maculata, Strain CCMP736" /LENGTH=164 /DNA_ID=CAMNT_0016135131 /DNA_START=2135 /DNA_END=2629 /DNA_ORIENTATION=-
MSSAWRIRFWCGSTDPICSGLVILKVPRSSAYVVTCVCGGGLWSWMHSMGSAKKIEESDIPCQSPMRMCSGSAWCCFTLNVPTRWRSIDERNGTLWHESFGRLVSLRGDCVELEEEEFTGSARAKAGVVGMQKFTRFDHICHSFLENSVEYAADDGQKCDRSEL